MVIDADSAHTAATDKSDIQKLAVAPGGQFVAAFTQDGRLVVWVADFTKNLSVCPPLNCKVIGGTPTLCLCTYVRIY